MKITIISIFEEISTVVFPMKSLTEAQTYTIKHVQNSRINEHDKAAITRTISDCISLIQLQRYICNSLLKYEGMGADKVNKSARKAAREDSQE